MTGEYNHAAMSGVCLKERLNFLYALLIDTRYGFVQYPEAGFAKNKSRYGNSAVLPSGQCAARMMTERIKPNALEGFFKTNTRLRDTKCHVRSKVLQWTQFELNAVAVPNIRKVSAVICSLAANRLPPARIFPPIRED